VKIIYEPRGRALEYAALAANLSRGCAHRCAYCFAPGALRMKRDEFHDRPVPRAGVLKALERDAARMAGDQRTVLLSFTSDPYQPCEVDDGLTRRAIKVLKRHGLHVEILTKGGTRACRDFDLLDHDDRFATTLTCDNDHDSLAWEPGAALPANRVEAIKDAKSMGLTTWVSCEPVLYPEQTLRLIEMTAPFVDLFKVGTLNYHPRAKEIDWPAFALDVVSLLRRLGCYYYLKADLKEYLPGTVLEEESDG